MGNVTVDSERVVITEANWKDCAEACSQIRRQVFIVEQSVPEEEEWDGLDADANHFIVTRRNTQEVVACARLLTLQPGKTPKITRMAVLAPFRKQGIGRALLQTIITKAANRKFKKIVLDAQIHALGFYAQEGFQAYGDRFMDAGIEHMKMVKELSNSK